MLATITDPSPARYNINLCVSDQRKTLIEYNDDLKLNDDLGWEIIARLLSSEKPDGQVSARIVAHPLRDELVLMDKTYTGLALKTAAVAKKFLKSVRADIADAAYVTGLLRSEQDEADE